MDRGENYSSATSCMPSVCPTQNDAGFCVPNQTSDTLCQAGFELIEIAYQTWSCLPCPREWYKDTAGTQQCRRCPVQTDSPLGSTQCKAELVCNNAEILVDQGCQKCPVGKSTPSGFFILQTEYATVDTEFYELTTDVPRAWNTGNITGMFLNAFDLKLNNTQMPHAHVTFIALNASAQTSVIFKRSLSNVRTDVFYYARAYDSAPKRTSHFEDRFQKLKFDAEYEKIEVRAESGGTVSMWWGDGLENATQCVACGSGFYRDDEGQRTCLPCEPRRAWQAADEACIHCNNTDNSETEWASSTCVPCDAHRRYDDSDQLYVAGCPWCAVDTERRQGDTECTACIEGFARAAESTAGCRGLYEKQDACPTIGLNDAHTQYMIEDGMHFNESTHVNCSCTSTRVVRYLPTTNANMENCKDHLGWKGVQKNASGAICTVRACVRDANCTPDEVKWDTHALGKAELIIFKDGGPKYKTVSQWGDGHLHVALECGDRSCSRPVRVIDTAVTHWSRPVFQGFKFKPYEEVQHSGIQLRRHCEKQCLFLGDCSWYIWNVENKQCYVNRNSSALFDIDITKSNQPNNEQYNDIMLENNLASAGMRYKDFEVGDPMDIVYYINNDTIQNRHVYFEKVTENKEIQLRSFDIYLYGSSQEQIRTCAELCIMESNCDEYVLQTQDGQNFAICQYHRPYSQMKTLNVTERYVRRENISHVCTENVRDRFYHSDDQVFSCTYLEKLEQYGKKCTPCPKNHIALSAPQCSTLNIEAECQECQACPKGYTLTEDQAQCRTCLSGQRRVSQKSSECIPCPSGHVQSNSSEFWCVPCPPGYNVSVDGNFSTCIPCADEFAGDPTQRDIGRCVRCPTYARRSDANVCKCPPGYQDAGDACHPCAPGTFAREYGEAECSACPPGMVAPHEQSVRCTPCLRDRGEPFTTKIQCLPAVCAPGVTSSCVHNVSSDTPCPAGEELVPLARNAWACLPCARGWYKSSNGTAPCEPCAGPEGTSPGATACSAVNPEQTYWTSAQHVVSAYAVPPGLVPVRETPTCALAPEEGVDYEVCACRPGFNLNYAKTRCLACASPHSTSTHNSTTCTACAPGHVWREKQACQMCAPSEIPNHEMLACESCPAGKTTVHAGGSTCVCDAGYYAVGQECERCPVGMFKSWPGDEAYLCTKCQGLEIPTTDKTACEICPRNQEASDDGDECVCGAGFRADADSRCIACGPGYYGPQKNATECQGCPRGKYMPDYGASVCRECAISEYTPETASTFCTLCPTSNSVRSDQTQECICDAGYYEVDYECLGCAFGTYKGTPGSQACEMCKNNTEGKADDSVITGRTSCGQCLDGSKKDPSDLAGDACQSCTDDDFEPADSEQEECNFCTYGATGLNKTTGKCLGCAAERPYIVENSCQKCSWKQGLRMPLIMQGDEGFLSNANWFGEYFPMGTVDFSSYERDVFLYRNANGRWETSSVESVGGSFILRSQDAVEYFVPGVEYNFNLFELNFNSDFGYRAKLGYAAEECTLCPNNTRAQLLGWESTFPTRKYWQSLGLEQDLLASETNTSITVNETIIRQYHYLPKRREPWITEFSWFPLYDCDIYQDRCRPGQELRNDKCTTCSEGAQSLDGRLCVCQPGFYNTSNRCLPCAVGTFKSLAGDGTCESCPEGTFSQVEATACLSCDLDTLPGNDVNYSCCVGWGYSGSRCSECTPGYFKNESGSVACTECAAGKYSNVSAATTCYTCTENAMSLAASTECSCNAGYVLVVSNCEACPAGKYMHYPNTSCTQWDSSGKCVSYSSNVDLCTQCPEGTTTLVQQPATSYSDCNQNCTDPSTHECTYCPRGKYTNVGCVDCPSGKYQPKVGQAKCYDCEHNCGNTSYPLHENCGGASGGTVTGVYFEGGYCNSKMYCCPGFKCVMDTGFSWGHCRSL